MRKRYYQVYKHTCLENNKVYIGLTSWTMQKRWAMGYHANPHFSSAITKYGYEGFTHEVLYEGLLKEEAQKKEIELIALYDSTNPLKGYNISTGGEAHTGCHFTHSANAKLKISLANKGKKRTTETKAKLSKSHKGLHNNPNLNKINKSYMKGNSYAKGHKGTTNKKCIPVKQWLGTTLIAEFKSIKEAERITGITHISSCLTGKRKTAGGFRWSK